MAYARQPIHIASTDADEDPFDITLTGTGVTPPEAWRYQLFVLNFANQPIIIHTITPGNPLQRRSCQIPDCTLLCAMGITITIPEEVACILGTGQKEREQRACESIAPELYREGRITLRTMGRLAGVGEDYWAADAFRARHGLPVNTGDDEPENEMAAINRLLEP